MPIKSNSFPGADAVCLDDPLFAEGPALGERIEIWESAGECLIEIDIVNLTKDGCRAFVENGTLILEGEKWIGRKYEAFKRCIRLSTRPAGPAVKSEYQKGVLSIRVPVKPSNDIAEIALKV